MIFRTCRFPAPPFDYLTETHMQYLLLIYNTETKSADAHESAAIMKEYGDFTRGIIESGQYKGGNALQPVTTATSVRVRDGKTLLTDGPFAETVEHLGGYYLIEAANLDDATSVAARIPGARAGTIEVRPIWSMPAPA
jgi:hypothetical protein